MADPIWLEKAIRDEGVTISVFPNAYNRGHGDFGPGYLKPFMHHTGSFGETANGIANHPSLGLASQVFLGKDGKAVLCGVGIAWHAGVGSGFGLPTNNGNAKSIGIEAAHDGVSPWSEAQYGSYLRIVRAMNRAQGHDLNDVVAHKEYGAIQGKWDPGNLDMKLFRQRLLQAPDAKPIVINMIELEAKENPWVGVRHAKPGAEGEKVCGKDGKGRWVEYDNAHIYFHPSIGAFAIPHADPAIPGSGIFEAWASRGWETSFLGFPVRDFSFVEGHGVKGAVMAFQGGVLYVADDPRIGAHSVQGIIGQRWSKEGFEDGPLGWPISEEQDNGFGGKIQHFQFGSLQWDLTGAVKELSPAEKGGVDDLGLPKIIDLVQVKAA